ncbi:sulfotransferase family protein [Nocardioides sp. Root140]|uniref:sulfotransferase family protein n=1 Tax=Nocardioides sp. Root140 TaxID=1736460 RepID=UPI0006FF10CB|nr:sulfotransferase family protein [Nocardioides sp. Root140]KQY50204.1 hypothetical protein ASD30_22045 [Nocardioides sp. Root140]
MSQPTPPLPEDAVLLHIGPHKTGTTAIQGILAAAREDLLEHAVTYPGRHGAHHGHARALRQHPAGWTNDTEEVPSEKQWENFARKVRNTPGRVVVSSEFFAQSEPAEISRAVADLDPERLHVLIAARNPGSIALSTWQQVLRDGKAGHLSAWLDKGFKRQSPAVVSRGFWSWADTATLVERWSEVLPVDRIRVVVIDEADRALLPATFEQLLDLPPQFLSTRTPAFSNRGLTAPEAELLRQVIEENRDRLTWTQFSLMIRYGMVARILKERRPDSDEPKSALPPWAVEQARVEADCIIERLRASGVAVSGDLENLRRLPATGETPEFDQIPISIAVQGISGAITSALKGMEQADAHGREEALREAQLARKPRKHGRKKRQVEDMSTRELMKVLNARVRAGLRRRLDPRVRRKA